MEQKFPSDFPNTLRLSPQIFKRLVETFIGKGYFEGIKKSVTEEFGELNEEMMWVMIAQLLLSIEELRARVRNGEQPQAQPSLLENLLKDVKF